MAIYEYISKNRYMLNNVKQFRGKRICPWVMTGSFGIENARCSHTCLNDKP